MLGMWQCNVCGSAMLVYVRQEIPHVTPNPHSYWYSGASSIMFPAHHEADDGAGTEQLDQHRNWWSTLPLLLLFLILLLGNCVYAAAAFPQPQRNHISWSVHLARPRSTGHSHSHFCLALHRPTRPALHRRSLHETYSSMQILRQIDLRQARQRRMLW